MVRAMKPTLTAQVSVDPRNRKPYARALFGGFLEHFDDQVAGGVFDPGSPLSDDAGFRTDVIAALQELDLAMVRWPGGCFASGYHWRDGVGDVRRPVADPVWGVDDPNTFGTDEFLAWCRAVGCEPYLCTNAGSGTAEEMADWVAHCNASGRSPVRLWSVGNENWGAHEIGARTPQEWGPLVRRCADAMRAVDPELDLAAAATTDPAWTLPLLAAAGDRLQYVAIHEYWLACHQENLTPDYLSCVALSDGPEATITQVLALLDQAGCRGRVKIAFDEWNLRGWHHPGFPRKTPTDPDDLDAAALIRARAKNAIASQYTMADALFSASFLNACLRHADDVEIASIAPIVNTRGPLFVHPEGIVRRTTFHVLKMYARLLADRVAETAISGDTIVHGERIFGACDAVATCDEAGNGGRIALVNRHPSASLACAVTWDGTPLQGSVSVTRLAGDDPGAFNDIAHPERVVPEVLMQKAAEGHLVLPPHSLSIVAVP